jgi:Uma2 family endonuclease
MGSEEQARVVESLPGEVTWDEMAMPEGDRHFGGRIRARNLLEGYFRHQRRKVYLGSELPTYYPGERRFAPDLVAVLGAETHDRDKWVVSYEGRGLDWVLEVHVGGDRKKDAEYNVERYARLGIPEYFIYDRAKERLEAYRLATPEARQYARMAPRRGRYVSDVLGLDFEVSRGRLLIWDGNALLLETEELLELAQARLDQALRPADEETRLLQEEMRRREAAERRVAELQAQLELLQHRE